MARDSRCHSTRGSHAGLANGYQLCESKKIVNGHREIRGFCSIFRSYVIGEEKHNVKNGISGRRVSYETGRSIDVNARIIGLKTIRQSLLLFTCRTKGNL